MQLMAQGAGSFELFGYGLLTAAFAILAIGVVWSLTRSISDSYRFLLRLLFTVLIVKIAAAAFLSPCFSRSLADPPSAQHPRQRRSTTRAKLKQFMK